MNPLNFFKKMINLLVKMMNNTKLVLKMVARFMRDKILIKRITTMKFQILVLMKVQDLVD
jgi:hypothetical protein